MSLTKVIDNFIFIYDLEPAEWCSNFRFNSQPIWKAGSPSRSASFAVWQNMLSVSYHILDVTEPLDGIQIFKVARADAHSFATAVISCFGFLRAKHLEYSLRNWVEFVVPSLATKIVVGKSEAYSEPPIDHTDNQAFEKIATLMPLILNNAPLARALDDYYSCLSKTSPDFYVFAYRAVEDIRSHFGASDDDKQRIAAWNEMNKALNRKKENYDELKGFAEKYRHANMLGEVIDHESAQKQVSFVGSLIHDFIEYLSAISTAADHPSKLDSETNPSKS